MSGWITLHEINPYAFYYSSFPMEEMEWREVTVNASSIFCIAPAPHGWASGCVVHSHGPTYLKVRETRDEVIALCEVARKGRM